MGAWTQNLEFNHMNFAAAITNALKRWEKIPPKHC
jgi:hypothetical protein